VPVDLPGPVGDVLLERGGLPEDLEDRVGDLLDRLVDAGRDVDRLADDGVERYLARRRDRLGGVEDVQPVAAGDAVPMDRQRLVGERLDDEARNDLLGMLEGPVVVERADDRDGQVVRAPVRERQPVAARGYGSPSQYEQNLQYGYGTGMALEWSEATTATSKSLLDLYPTFPG
jgi:hypothetical protein